MVASFRTGQISRLQPFRPIDLDRHDCAILYFTLEKRVAERYRTWAKNARGF